MAQLTLDYYEWDTLVRHLDGVRVPQLVRGEPSAQARYCPRVVQLLSSGGRLPAAAGGWPADHAEDGPDR